MREQSLVKRIPWWLAGATLTIVVLGPLYWIFASSFKTRQEVILQRPTWFPHAWTFANIDNLLSQTDYLTYLRNSFTVALGTTAVSLVISFAAAYGLYRIKVSGSKVLAGAILLSYLIPGTLLIVPLYKTLSNLHLIDTYQGLILVNVAFTAPFCTWLLKGFIDSIPKEIDEAAELDGAGPIRTMVRVVFPLMAPGVATVSVYSFIYSWTEFVFASQFIVSDNLKTLPIGLSSLVGQYTVNWGLVMAGAMFTILPTIVIFLAVGKYFVGGLVAGATK